MLKKEVLRLANLLTTKKRDNGETFICCKDNASEADREIIREFHGTDILPDDFRYSSISGLLDTMSNYDCSDIETLEDLRHEIIDSNIDIYTKDLLTWLASNTNRVDYCNKAIDDGITSGDIMSIISYGQFLELDGIYSNILSYLGDIEVEEVA